MIGKRGRLLVADNTGAQEVECIGILGGTRKRVATIGDIISVSIKNAQPRTMVKKGEVHRAVVVRTRKELRRKDGSYIRFDNNECVLLEGENPKGNRLFGPFPRELRDKFPKIISLAPEVL